MDELEVSVIDEESTELEDIYNSIEAMEEVSRGCYKIRPSKGPSFFLRVSYLSLVPEDRVRCGQSFSKEEFDDFVKAGLAFAAEQCAMNYLNRCEHSRFLLKQKLLKKEHSSESVEMALDYLEGKNYLSDYRFALSWLRNRRITHAEGRTKLLQNLLSRGVDRKTAQTALDEFFEEFPEISLLDKAYQKCLRQKLTEEKLMKKLTNLGFSSKLLKEYLSNY